MEMTYPKFTKEMKATHTILIPNMAVTQFRLLKASMESEGYHVEVLGFHYIRSGSLCTGG